MPTVGYAHRPVAYGCHGLVASAHAQATLVGIDVLRSGGNAVDAAIAVNATLAVVQPQACGPGGDLFCLLFDAPSGEVVCLNGAGRSGSRATIDAIRGRGLQAVPLIGPFSVSVPGCVDAWGALAANLLDFGMGPQEAIERPRFVQGRVRVADPEDRLRIEGRVPRRVRAALARRGHVLDVVADWTVTMGHAQALTVRTDGDGRLYAGGADPRGDGLALGY